MFVEHPFQQCVEISLEEADDPHDMNLSDSRLLFKHAINNFLPPVTDKAIHERETNHDGMYYRVHAGPPPILK